MNSTIVGLVAAIAVLSGGLGFSMTGVFDDQNLTSNLPATAGFLMGQVEIEARNADGELFAYRLGDNEVVDDGEQCILKMLFSTEDLVAGRGSYATEGTGACSGVLTGAWNVIAIGDCNLTSDCAGLGLGAGDGSKYDTGADLPDQDLLVRLGNETKGVKGLERGIATSITWHNGTGDSVTKIVLAKTFTRDGGLGSISIGESGLFNGTYTETGTGMLARQMFTDVSLSDGDSITVTWTFTVGN